MKKSLLFLAILFISLEALAQSPKTENLIIVTLDGMRWQEVFGGMDDSVASQKEFNSNMTGLNKKFKASTREQRRQLLFPFLWGTIAKEGQLYGNRWKGSKVENANKYWFSYPGYSEIFTGFPDDSVNSNEKVWNRNINVLEFINQQPAYKNKVATFATWDVFPYILNTKRSGLYVNADVDSLKFSNPALQLVNDMQFLTSKPIEVRPDVFTYFAAREYLKAYKPKVLYIAFDETDDFAHAGRYEQYIYSAHAEDAMIGDLWKTVQSMPEYKDKTTLIITVDHGRGDAIKAQWKDHGQNIKDSRQIWIAAMGAGVKPLGELRGGSTIFQGQLAATLAKLLGFTFKTNHPVMPVISSIANVPPIKK